jgi:hypothetical protein
MPTSHYTRQAQQIQQFLSSAIDEADDLSGFGQRQSKLDARTFAQTVILGLLQTPNASLNQLAYTTSRLGTAVSRQALHARMDAAGVMLLAGLLQSALRFDAVRARLPLPLLQPFSAVWVLDSTQIALPKALRPLFRGNMSHNANLKVHLSLDYLSGNLGALEWVEGRSPDQNCRLHLQLAQPNSLHLFDLGYFDQAVLTQLDQRGAYFVSRLQPQTALFDPHTGIRLDLAAHLRRLRLDWSEQPWLVGRNARLPLRVIMRRLPRRLASERRRKARLKAQQRGKTCSADQLTLLGWEVFITNVPLECLNPEQVCRLYGIRWQIELHFKAWKSQLKVAAFGPWRTERVLCYLYARFIVILLLHQWLAPYRCLPDGLLSWVKAIQLVQQSLPRLLDAIRHHWRGLEAFFRQLKADLSHFARQDKRCKSPSSFQRLLLVNP